MQSGLSGEERSQQWDKKFRNVLINSGLLRASDKSDQSVSAGRKWRSVFEKLGFTYPKVKKEEKSYGPTDSLTPAGRALVEARNEGEIFDAFTRAITAPVFEALAEGEKFSPLLWVIEIMAELSKREEKNNLSFKEFKNFVQLTSPRSNKVSTVVDAIVKSRKTKLSDEEEIKIFYPTFDGKQNENSMGTFKDYADMNLRYLKATGLFVDHSTGIIPNPLKEPVFKKFLQERKCFKTTYFENKKAQCLGFPMFYDEITQARILYRSQLEIAHEEGIVYQAPFDLNQVSEKELKSEYNKLYLQCFIQSELRYAQKQPQEWQEITEYMKLLSNTKQAKKSKTELKIPKDMKPAYFEWVIWRSILAIDSLKNKPGEVRGFKVDTNFLPIYTAPAGTADLVADFQNYRLAVEVTLSESSRQEAMEGEPVRRHVANLCEKDKTPTFGLFLANNIHTNTAETFRHGLWYFDDDSPVQLGIVPMSLSDFQRLFEWFFLNKISNKAEKLQHILSECLKGKENLTAPEWKRHIQKVVEENVTQGTASLTA